MLTLLDKSLIQPNQPCSISITQHGTYVNNQYGHFQLKDFTFDLPSIEWVVTEENEELGIEEERVTVPAIHLGQGIYLDYKEGGSVRLYDVDNNQAPFHSQYENVVLKMIKSLVPACTLDELKESVVQKVKEVSWNELAKPTFEYNGIEIDVHCIDDLIRTLSFRSDEEVLEWVCADNSIRTRKVKELKEFVVAYNDFKSEVVIRNRRLKDDVLGCEDEESLRVFYLSGVKSLIASE